MFKVCVIASGSKGNCLVVHSREHAVILDAGIPVRRILSVLDRFHIDRSIVRAVLISHEHSDHTRSVGALSRTLQIPVYITEPTYYKSLKALGDLKGRIKFFQSEDEFPIGDIVIRSFQSNHDAVDGCNFTFTHAEMPWRKLGVATDLGKYLKTTERYLKECSTIVLESNHDKNMLLNGSYEWFLKQRISGEDGHLSNEQAVALVRLIHHPEIKHIVLAHLSEENNKPEIAYNTMKEFLDTIRSDINLIVASQDTETDLLDV